MLPGKNITCVACLRVLSRCKLISICDNMNNVIHAIVLENPGDALSYQFKPDFKAMSLLLICLDPLEMIVTLGLNVWIIVRIFAKKSETDGDE